MWLFSVTRSKNLEGHGVIQSLGGDGYHGGAGGRIATYLQEEIYYHGDFDSLGGGGKGLYLTSGGPGSVYIFDYRCALSLSFTVTINKYGVVL